MSDQEKDTTITEGSDNSTEKRQKEDSLPFGCLFSWTFITGIIPVIIWIVWLVQDRPNNWCGKFCMFQLKATAIVITVCIVIALIHMIGKRVNTGRSGEDYKETNDEDAS